MSTADLVFVGKAGIALAGHWRYQTFDRADGFDFDVAPTAHWSARTSRSFIGNTGGPLRRPVDSDQAWEFVFATGPVGRH